MSDPLMQSLWLIHVTATLFLVGLIWVVQVVHYPLFARVGGEQFREYSQHHARLITWLVAPAMLLEGGTATLFLLIRPAPCAPAILMCGFALLVVNWLSTWCIQIPLHERLANHFTTATHERLVRTNWIRTTAWTVRGVLVVVQTAWFMM